MNITPFFCYVSVEKNRNGNPPILDIILAFGWYAVGVYGGKFGMHWWHIVIIDKMVHEHGELDNTGMMMAGAW